MNYGDNHKSQVFKIQIVTGDKMLKMDIPPREDLIDGLIGAQSLTFLAGEEGCGKSLLAMSLSISVACGMEQWLSYSVKKSGTVLFLNNEVTVQDFARRLKSMTAALPTECKLENLLIVPETPLIRQCSQSIDKTCEAEKPVLLVIDCLYLAHDEDENDSTAMRQMMRYLLSLRNKYGLAVLVVHHTRKGASKGKLRNDLMRGSGVFGGATDTVVIMRRSDDDESKRIIKPTKGRHITDESRKEHYLELDPNTLWFKDGGEVSDQIADARAAINWQGVFGQDEELKYADILSRCETSGYSSKTIQRLLDGAVVGGLLQKKRHGYYTLNRIGGNDNASDVG